MKNVNHLMDFEMKMDVEIKTNVYRLENCNREKLYGNCADAKKTLKLCLILIKIGKKRVNSIIYFPEFVSGRAENSSTMCGVEATFVRAS